jgi:CheY-like chemotaxis protein
MESTTSKPGTILVVDDQPANVELIRRWLEPDGHVVVTASSGESALAAVKTQPPDVVLLDILIPAPNGFEVCERLKKDVATKHIAVLLMSGLQEASNFMRGEEAGADGLMHKPLKASEVRAKVQEYVDKSRR